MPRGRVGRTRNQQTFGNPSHSIQRLVSRVIASVPFADRWGSGPKTALAPEKTAEIR